MHMKSKIVAFIEKDLESDCYVAIVPGIPGAHTQANILDELQVRLKEVIELCLEEMDPEERKTLPEIVVKERQPVYLTKNGYGSMVVLSLEKYAELTDDIELKLDEVDKEAATTDIRYTHDEIFSRVRERIDEKK
jgi:predicted RNase H-like HicB family nuclease